MRRRAAAADDLATHLEWLATIIRDRQVPTRQVFEGILDALEALADALPDEPSKGPDR